MKFLFITCLCACLCWHDSIAQDNRNRGKRAKHNAKSCTLLGFGGNYAFFAPAGFNEVLQEFNQKFATLNGQFPTLTATSGGSFVLTSYGNHGESKARMWYELGARGNFNTLTATEKISQNPTKIQQQFYTAHFGLGALPIQTQGFDLALAASIDGGALLTNLKGTNFLKDYTHAQTDLFYGFSLMMPMYLNFGDHFSIGIRPYYQYQINSISFKEMQKKMNTDPLSAQLPTNEPDKTLSKFSNYGISAHLNIVFRKIKER